MLNGLWLKSFWRNLVLLQYAKRSKKFHHEYNFISIQTLHTHLLLCSLRHLRTPTPKVRTIRNVLVWTDHQLDKSMKGKKRVDEKLSITWYLTIIPNETISYNCFSGCKSITSTYLWFSSIDLFQNVDKLL